MPRPSRLLLALRRELAALGDPERARGAQAYMKSAMPFHGVGAVPLRAICRRLFAELPLPDAEAFRREVLGVFRGAKYREELYAAVELARLKRAAPLRDLAFLPVCEEMVVTGAWWDVVDPVASHLLGELLRKEPRRMRREMLAWAACDDLWKRRSAILCQLGFKRDTDLDLLYACIEPSLGSKEFFLRKAIGWALRQYALDGPGRGAPVRDGRTPTASRASPGGRRRSTSAERRPGESAFLVQGLRQLASRGWPLLTSAILPRRLLPAAALAATLAALPAEAELRWTSLRVDADLEADGTVVLTEKHVLVASEGSFVATRRLDPRQPAFPELLEVVLLDPAGGERKLEAGTLYESTATPSTGRRSPGLCVPRTRRRGRRRRRGPTGSAGRSGGR